jgi:hypothetical protein
MELPLTKIRIEVVDGELSLTRAAGLAKLTDHSTRQLCKLADVPIAYARRIPPTLLCMNINHGLAYRKTAHKENAQMLIKSGWLESIRVRPMVVAA